MLFLMVTYEFACQSLKKGVKNYFCFYTDMTVSGVKKDFLIIAFYRGAPLNKMLHLKGPILL